MSIMRPPKKPRSKGIVRWRPRLPRLRGNGRLSRPLAAAGTTLAVVTGGVAATIVLGGVVVVGVGALAVGAFVGGSLCGWVARRWK